MSLEPLELQVKSDGFVVAAQRAKELTSVGASVEAMAKKLGKAHSDAADAVKSAQERALESVRQSLLSEEEAIRESYLRRRKVIEQSSAPGATKMGLLARLDSQQSKELDALAAGQARAALVSDALNQRKAAEVEAIAQRERAQLDGVKRSLMTEEQLIRASEDDRRRIIISNTTITAKEREELLRLSAQKTHNELASIESSRGKAGAFANNAAMIGMVAAGAAVLGGREVVKTTREFEKLNAALMTATGSEQEAAIAFQVLQKVAETTPFSLRNVTDGFTKLRNTGLDPSLRALKAYGDMASATGSEIGDAIDAVVAATVGEMEPLKKFGITSQQEGEKVSFTFRGMKTTVERNAQAIEEYLRKLAENNFSGAMEVRMRSLDGSLSNLGDAWDRFTLTVSRSGLGGAIKDVVDTMTNLLAVSDQVQNRLETGMPKITIGNMQQMGMLREFLRNRIAQLEKEPAAADPLAKYRADADKIEAQRAQSALAELQKHMRTQREVLRDEYDKESKVIEKATVGNADKKLEITRKLQDRYTGELAKLQAEEAEKAARSPKAGNELAAAKKQFQSMQDQFDPIDKLNREDAEREKLILRFTKRDADAQEKMLGQNRDFYNKSLRTIHEGLDKEENAKRAAAEKALEEVRDSLMSEEDTIRRAYARRRQIVQDSAAGPESREKLLKVLEEQENLKLRVLEDSRQREREALFDQYAGEESQLLQTHQRRQKTIEEALKKREITEADYRELSAREEKRSAEEITSLRAQQAQMSLKGAGDMFGAFASIAKKAGGEESKTYRTLFALSKAFAVGQATVAMYTAMASGMAKGWPEGIPLMLSAAAQGAGILANIAGAEYSGAYDRGGTIPAGKVGLVGERRPELVYGPAQVVGSADTARMMSGGFQQSAQQPINLKVVTAPDVAGARQFMTSSEGETTFLALARKHATTIRKMVA